MFARNAYNRESGRTPCSSPRPATRARTVTGNRTEFLGRNGTLADPAALRRARLSGKTGAGLDPCAAMQSQVELADGQEREVVFVLRRRPRTASEAQQLVQRFSGPAGARQALEGVWEFWNRHARRGVRWRRPTPR